MSEWDVVGYPLISVVHESPAWNLTVSITSDTFLSRVRILGRQETPLHLQRLRNETHGNGTTTQVFRVRAGREAAPEHITVEVINGTRGYRQIFLVDYHTVRYYSVMSGMMLTVCLGFAVYVALCIYRQRPGGRTSDETA